MIDYKELPYRKGAQALVLNENEQVLLVQLNCYKDNEWNIPGGGRESGETPEENAFREIVEELGIKYEQLTILAKSAQQNIYNFPHDFQNNGSKFSKTYRGQIKDQFIIRFSGTDEDINIDENEIRRYRWVDQTDLSKYLIFDGQMDSVAFLINEYTKKYR